MVIAMTSTTFTQWLYTEMRQRRLSQSELARKAGVAQATISYVLSGERNPGAEFCVAISRALNVPAEEVFRRAGLLPADPEETPTLREALHLFRQLPPEQQRQKIAEMRAIIELLESDRRIRSSTAGGREREGV